MATYRVEWKSSAIREIRRLDRQAIPRVIDAIDSLSSDPLPRGSRKLHAGERTYRIRVGDYRVVYEILEGESVVEIIRVRHRSEAYQT